MNIEKLFTVFILNLKYVYELKKNVNHMAKSSLYNKQKQSTI